MQSIHGEDVPIQRYLTYFHEAGHAVAACDRKRAVHEIFIHPERGYTRHGSKDTPYKNDDHQFIVWAGPWAEARARWQFEGKNTRGENVQAFTNEVRSFLRKNGHDWREFHEAMGRDVTDDDVSEARMVYDQGLDTPPRGEYEPSDQWDEFLDGMWLHINTLATNLMAGDEVIMVDGRQQNLVKVPNLWRRWGWEPPEGQHGDRGDSLERP